EQAEQVLGARPANPNLLASRINLGQALRQLDRYDEALDVFGRGVGIDNAKCDGRAYKSTLLMDIAEYEVAEKLLSEAIERVLPCAAGDAAMADRLGWLYSARGWALRCAGKSSPKVLVDAFREALKFAPHDQYAQKNLAHALLRNGPE